MTAMSATPLATSASDAFPIAGPAGLAREEAVRNDWVLRTPSNSLLSSFVAFFKSQPVLRWTAISIVGVGAAANALLIGLSL